MKMVCPRCRYEIETTSRQQAGYKSISCPQCTYEIPVPKEPRGKKRGRK